MIVGETGLRVAELDVERHLELAEAGGRGRAWAARDRECGQLGARRYSAGGNSEMTGSIAMIGRDRELEAIATLFEPQENARVFLIEGAAGLGKTTLLRACVEEGRARNYRVLSCAPTRSETQLSLSAVRDLIEPVFDEIAQAIPAPQRRALAVTLLREDPGETPPPPDAIAVAFLSALRALAHRRTTIVVIDDVQWLDGASAGTLAYAIRRLDREPVPMVLARRVEGEESLPLDLDRIARERLEIVRLTGLSVGALGRILHERLGVSYPRTALRRLHEISVGNPFFALELARALGDDHARLRSGEPLPVPDTLRGLVHERVAALPPLALDALAIAAMLLKPTLGLIGTALGLDARPLLEPAIDANIVAVDGEYVRFLHPLFASAILGRLPPGRRREIHRRLAPLVGDLEERAGHLALATEEPDEEIARAIDDGAREAFLRGGAGSAADLAAEALRLTPPSARDDGWKRMLAEADYRFASGDMKEASRLLDDLVAHSPGPEERARALSRQARVRHFERDIGSSVALLYEALAVAGNGTAIRGEIEEGLAWGLLLTRRDLARAAEHAAAATRLAEARGDDAALSEALAAQALTEFVLGRPWRETMDRALALESATLGLRVLRHPSFAYGYCLSCADDVIGARAVFEQLMRRARDHGDESSAPSLLNHLTMVELLGGNWAAANDYASDGYARALEGGQEPTQASILGRDALLKARRGALAEAREIAIRSLAVSAGPGFEPSHPEAAMAGGGEVAMWALGSVELSLGNAERAHLWLGPLCDALLVAGVDEPGEVRALADDVEALVALGQVDKAEALVERLEAWARRVARPSVLGAANRCRGLLFVAQDDDASALAAFERAALAEEHSQLPFERAHTLLALGAHQRRVRQRSLARDTLGRAAAIYSKLGSAMGLQRAQAEIARIGGRRGSGDELTPTERQIAELVAEGRKNREVAAALVVTERTVEAALTTIFRKLEVRSRTELARKLARAD